MNQREVMEIMTDVIQGLDEFCTQLGSDGADAQLAYYQTYLLQTDYVAAKMAEAMYTGGELDEDYAEVLKKRAECRQKINELQNEYHT